MISTDENRVVAAVREWNQNETYNLYVSDTSGVYYTLALENVVSSMGPEGNVMVDLYEVSNLSTRFTRDHQQDCVAHFRTAASHKVELDEWPACNSTANADQYFRAGRQG